MISHMVQLLTKHGLCRINIQAREVRGIVQSAFMASEIPTDASNSNSKCSLCSTVEAATQVTILLTLIYTLRF